MLFLFFSVIWNFEVEENRTAQQWVDKFPHQYAAINEKIWDNDVEFIAELDVLIRGIEKNFQKVDLIVKTARNCIISNLVFQGTKILNTEKYNQSKKKVVQVQL